MGDGHLCVCYADTPVKGSFHCPKAPRATDRSRTRLQEGFILKCGPLKYHLPLNKGPQGTMGKNSRGNKWNMDFNSNDNFGSSICVPVLGGQNSCEFCCCGALCLTIVYMCVVTEQATTDYDWWGCSLGSACSGLDTFNRRALCEEHLCVATISTSLLCNFELSDVVKITLSHTFRTICQIW